MSVRGEAWSSTGLREFHPPSCTDPKACDPKSLWFGGDSISGAGDPYAKSQSRSAEKLQLNDHTWRQESGTSWAPFYISILIPLGSKWEQFFSLTPNAALRGHHVLRWTEGKPSTQRLTSPSRLAPWNWRKMRQSGLPEVRPRIYLICRIPKLGGAASESPEEPVESSDARFWF